MKAAILREINAPLEIVDLIPPHVGVGMVLVKVRSATICGAQIGEVTGAKGEDPYLPHLLGHEGAGEVIEVGRGVTSVQPGDHVVLHWRKGGGIEGVPPKYHTMAGEEIGAGLVATFTEFAVVSENRVTKIGGDVPFDVASLMGCAVTTGLGIVNNEARLKIGQSIAVIGCGGVGLNVIQGAAMVSAFPIVAIDVHKEKLAMASLFGATHLFDAFEIGDINDLLDSVPEHMSVVVECTGVSEMIDAGLKWVASGGRLILVGQPHFKEAVLFDRFAMHYVGKTIMDSQGGLTDPTQDIPRYLELYKNGRLKLDRMITHWFPLAEINEAFKVAVSGKAGRVCLQME